MDVSISRLREATRPLHERLDALPYAKAAGEGSISLDGYASFLRAVHEVHAALEQAIERSGSATLRQVFGDAHLRRAALERDLAYLRIDTNAVDAAILNAVVLAQRIRLAALREPTQLLGFTYVLEGSQLGGLVQRAALAKRPELQDGGLDYLSARGSETRPRFAQFLERLAGALDGEATLEAAITGAAAAFEGFEGILRALTPGQPPQRWLVTELNTDAGTHPVPSDLREVAAALRAGEASWMQHTYYAARFGERGLSFTRSDSAWLATLVCEEAAQAGRQVHWLARVLAARGMPRLLLELHLEQLCDALSAAIPERAARYRTLRDLAADLREARVHAISDARTSELVDAFRAVITQPEDGIVPEAAARLLVASVADERCGIPEAVSSLTSWLADPARFSAGWVKQVTRTLGAARSPT